MQKRLHTTCNQWLLKVAQALARYDHVPVNKVNLLLSTENMFRLLNWKAWSIRYAVSVDFILSTLLEYYRKIRHRIAGTCHLGVSVAQLTGPRAQQIIEQEVAAAFPSGENYSVRTSEKRSQILSVRLQKYQVDETTLLTTSLKQYRERIKSQQKRNLTLPKHFTRSWRGNPFHGPNCF